LKCNNGTCIDMPWELLNSFPIAKVKTVPTVTVLDSSLNILSSYDPSKRSGWLASNKFYRSNYQSKEWIVVKLQPSKLRNIYTGPATLNIKTDDQDISINIHLSLPDSIK
ncbi:MAG: hypothetical protein AAFY71_28375, partial [Bacteroidota bacterium]